MCVRIGESAARASREVCQVATGHEFFFFSGTSLLRSQDPTLATDDTGNRKDARGEIETTRDEDVGQQGVLTKRLPHTESVGGPHRRTGGGAP